jgi:hypothetical protein
VCVEVVGALGGSEDDVGHRGGGFLAAAEALDELLEGGVVHMRRVGVGARDVESRRVSTRG